MFHIVGVPVVQHGIKEFIIESYVGCIVASTEYLLCKVRHAHLYAPECVGVLFTSSVLAELAFSLTQLSKQQVGREKRLPTYCMCPETRTTFLLKGRAGDV